MRRISEDGVARPESSMGVAWPVIVRSPRPSKTLGVPPCCLDGEDDEP